MSDQAGMTDQAPFILTLTLDPQAQAHFDALRARHFPADRLFVGAHVTLFHALPRDLGLEVIRQAAIASDCFAVQVRQVRFLGRGVAFGLESHALRALRNRLRQGWVERLTAQDRQPWQPHVTIQNKVAPQVARALRDALQASFAPYEVTATGLELWIYRNGPWEAAERFPFGGAG